MATTNYAITIDTSQAERSLNSISSKIDGLATTGSKLGTIFGGIFAGATLASLASFSDSVTEVSNRLRIIAKDQADVNTQFDAMVAISLNTRTSLAGVTDVYNKLITSSNTLGISQQDAAKLTTTLSQALALSGISGQRAAESMTQIGQGISAGVFQGDELRTIMEGNITVQQALAKELGVSTTQLKKLGSEGVITGKVFVDAMTHAADTVQSKWALMVPPITAAMTELQTAFMKMWYEVEKNTKVGESVSAAIEIIAMAIVKLSTHIDEIAATLEPFVRLIGGLLIFTTVGKAVEMFAGILGGLFGAVGTAVGGFKILASTVEDFVIVGTKLVTRGSEIAAVLGGWGGVFRGLAGGISIAVTALGPFAKILLTIVGSIAGYMGFSKIIDWFKSLGDASSEARKGLVKDKEEYAKNTSSALDNSKAKTDAVLAASKQVTEQISRETAALNKLVAAYKESTIEAGAKFQMDTSTIGMSEKQKLTLEQYTSALDSYRQKITEIKADIAAKQATGSEADLAMIPKLRAALDDVTQAYHEQAAGINDLVSARLAAEASYQLDLFNTKQQIDVENQLIKIRDEMAKSTMPELEQKYYDITAAAKASAKAAIEAEEARRKEKLDPAEVEAYYAAALKGSDALKKAQEEAYNKSREFSTGWHSAFNSYYSDATNTANQVKKVFDTVTKGLEDTLVNFVKTGKFQWKDFLSSVAEMILRSGIQRLIAEAFGGITDLFSSGSGGGSLLGGLGSLIGGLFGGGSSGSSNKGNTGGSNILGTIIGGAGSTFLGGIGNAIGGLFNGSGSGGGFLGGIGSILGDIGSGIGSLFGFADGGMVPNNNPVLVGERGPEILAGAGGMSVIPNSALGTHITYNINAVDALSFKQLLARDPAFVHAIVSQGAKSIPVRR